MKTLGMTLLVAIVAILGCTSGVASSEKGDEAAGQADSTRSHRPDPPDIAAEGSNKLATRAIAGDQTPAFSVTDLKGNTVSSDHLDGKVTYLNFFAAGCGYCLRKWPHVESEIWERFKNNPHFQMANVGRDHSGAELRGFKKQKNIQSPLAPDPERKVYLKFAESYSPRGVLIGPDGVIIEHVIWYDPKRMEKTVDTIEMELAKLKK